MILQGFMMFTGMSQYDASEEDKNLPKESSGLQV